MLDSGMWLYSMEVPLWSLLPDVPSTSCICRSNLLPRHCKDVQSPWVGLLCPGAVPSPPHSLNAAARRLVRSRDRQEEQDLLPCADSLRAALAENHWRPALLRWRPWSWRWWRCFTQCLAAVPRFQGSWEAEKRVLHCFSGLHVQSFLAKKVCKTLQSSLSLSHSQRLAAA